MQTIQKHGAFYLGKMEGHDPLYYDSKDLTTHAVCVGMTGSGKTGLGIALLEEAGLDKVPCLIIDPKGDLTNLLLTFPKLSGQDFLPWIDLAEAERNGMTPENYAEKVATTWKDGLAKWDEDGARIQQLKDTAEMIIYTPASRSGVPLSILSSFDPPAKEVLLDSELLRDQVLSVTSSLLGLIGINADPIKSRELILISTLIEQAWKQNKSVDIAGLIQQIQKPPFEKIGALDVDTFFPAKDRLALSISLNNLLASPQFQAWMQGGPLDIQQLLYTKEGKPKLSILSIAHLSDAERMFFVTLLLNATISWMRKQPGTSNLRALLYMDEIFGFFPPTAAPPSKKPMLTLLKQARAFGLGIVLATQNPVDLDYKGLANCGTWFIGKLQTDRDKAKVIEGLKVASNGNMQTDTLDKMLAQAGNRMFILRSVHEKEPKLFQTRWTLSYLRGPLTLPQIASLMQKFIKEDASMTKHLTKEEIANKPIIPEGITELYLNQNKSGVTHYKPYVAGFAKLHFVDSKNKIDEWQQITLLAELDDDGKTAHWDTATPLSDGKNALEKTALPNATFENVPAGLLQEKTFASLEKTFASALYQNQSLTLFYSKQFKLISNPGESEQEFLNRIAASEQGGQTTIISKIREKYADKIAQISEKVRKAEEKMTQKQAEAGMQKTQTFLSIGTAVLGAFFGKGVTKGTISQAGTSMKRFGRIGKDNQAASQAEADYNTYRQQLTDLQDQLNNDLARASVSATVSPTDLEKITVRPRKTDIAVEKVAFVWVLNT